MIKVKSRKNLIVSVIITCIILAAAVLLIVFADDIRSSYYEDFKVAKPVISNVFNKLILRVYYRGDII